MSASSVPTDPILRVRGLVKHFPLGGKGLLRRSSAVVRAVDGVSFDLHPGETLGVVGESGCGKSTMARALIRLTEPTAGEAVYDGRDIFSLAPKELRRLRRDIQIIFQDPYASLNPRMSVFQLISESWEIFPDLVPRQSRRARVGELLERVGLGPDDADRYPHQFSGGQRQRIGIARALALSPRIVICDEPVSALDVSVQAQVINLLEEIQDDFGLSYIFIAHDLSVVRHISDRVAVMYLGKIVEIGAWDDIYVRATHPYTQALLSAAPLPDPELRARPDRIMLEGEVPSPTAPPAGCRFHSRCWKRQPVCTREEPALEPRPASPHPSACHFAGQRELSRDPAYAGDAAGPLRS